MSCLHYIQSSPQIVLLIAIISSIVQIRQNKGAPYPNLLVGFEDYCHKDVQHSVDEQCDKYVEKDPRKEVYPQAFRCINGSKCGVHVITIDQAEETLKGGCERAEFHMKGSQYHPSGKDKGKVEDKGTGTKSKQTRN